MKYFVVMMLASFYLTSVFAQEVTEVDRNMSKGNNNAFYILLDSDVKTIQKAWKKYISKNKSKSNKLQKKTGEVLTDDAKVLDMSSNTVDIYASVTSMGSNVAFYVWFDLGGAYVSSETHPSKAKVAIKILDEFALTVSRTKILNELKIAQDILSAQQKELNSIEKTIKDSQKEIGKCQDKITRATQRIEKATLLKIDKKSEMASRQAKVKKVQNTLKELEQ